MGKVAAVVCLAAVLAVAGVQALHMHAQSSLNGSLDTHCSLCLVSHCVLRPQQAYVVAVPLRVLYRPRAPQTAQALQPRIFDRFVRPPPSV